MKRGPQPRPAVERFDAKVIRGEACWLWIGARQAGGYGRFMESSSPKRLVLAHRFAYEQAYGPIADDLTVDHLCLNTRCVNPEHLEAVTREVNARRGSRNARKTHCDYGHELTGGNVYVPPSRPHVRDCRACRVRRAQDPTSTRAGISQVQGSAGAA